MKIIAELTIPGEPVGKGRPRFTKNGHSFTPEKTVNYENLVKLTFKSDYPNAEPVAKDVPLAADITAWYRVPASASRKKQEAMLAQKLLPAKKPDTDNIAKAILDALNGLAYYDDAQIVELTVAKRYGTVPCVEVVISEVST